jgi:hypothetical protein
MRHAEKTVYTIWLWGGSIRRNLWHCSGLVRRRLQLADYFWWKSSISSFKQHLSTDLCYLTRPHIWPFVSCDCGFESRRRHGSLSVVIVVCCQVEVSAWGWSLFQRNPTECGVSQRDREISIKRRPWPTRGCYMMEKKLDHRKIHRKKGPTRTHGFCIRLFYCFAGTPKLYVLPHSKHTAYPLERRTNSHKRCSSCKSHETHKQFLRRYVDRQLHCALNGKFLTYISIVFYCTGNCFGKS